MRQEMEIGRKQCRFSLRPGKVDGLLWLQEGLRQLIDLALERTRQEDGA